MALEFQPIELDHAQDREGRLVLHDGRLIAVLSHLSADHEERSGHWFLECGFGELAQCTHDFPDLAAAAQWIGGQVSGAA